MTVGNYKLWCWEWQSGA